MPNYEEMFFMLFHAITDSLALIQQENIPGAILHLAKAQADSAELFMKSIDKDFKFDMEGELE